MMAVHLGGSQDEDPVVGNGGYCDGFLVEVNSHDIEHGGVKTVVRAASGAVMVADIMKRLCSYLMRTTEQAVLG